MKTRYPYFHFLAGIITLAMPAAGAFAEEKALPSLVTFQPASAWQIGPSELAYKDNAPRCALRSIYDNGFLLQLDMNSQLLETLNINFRQDVFNQGEHYQASVAIPGQKGQPFVGRALSPALLSIDLRTDPALFSAVQTVGALDVYITDYAFRFYLNGVPEALEQVQVSCAGSAPAVQAQAEQSVVREQSLPQTPMPAEKPLQSSAPETGPEMAQIAPAAMPEPEPQPEKPAIKINRQVAKAEIDFTKTGQAEPSAGQPFAQFEGSPPSPREQERIGDLAAKISELEGMVHKLKKENESLNGELQVTLSEGKHETLAIGDENWNLERATMRFQEAERQLNAMGQKLQRERAQCDVEKKDLEAMLFDPQVTNEQQMARLAQLEEEVIKSKAELENQRLAYEARIKAMQKTP